MAFSEAAYCLWRSRVGGMTVPDAKRLKDLEAENTRVKTLLAGQVLENDVIEGALRKTGLRPRHDPSETRAAGAGSELQAGGAPVSGSGLAGASQEAQEGPRWCAATFAASVCRQSGVVDGCCVRPHRGRPGNQVTDHRRRRHPRGCGHPGGTGHPRPRRCQRLDRLAVQRGLPQVIRTDNGKPFYGREERAGRRLDWLDNARIGALVVSDPYKKEGLWTW